MACPNQGSFRVTWPPNTGCADYNHPLRVTVLRVSNSINSESPKSQTTIATQRRLKRR